MQIKKSTIHSSVLEVARKEFLEKGFKDTNMRTIAQKAGVSVSNVYNYFPSKDELFRTVLSPAVSALDRITREHNNSTKLSIGIFESQEFIEEQTRIFVDIVRNHKEELWILLFKSHGSSMENFKEQYIERHTLTGLEYLRLMKEKHPQINGDVSAFFVHTVSSWWMGILGELVMHDLEEHELRRFVSEYVKYATAGWKKLLKVR